MRKYLFVLALATFAFTVGILFNGQQGQISMNNQLVSKPSLRSKAKAIDRKLQRASAEEDTDDSGIIEGVTIDDNSSDDGLVDPYEPIIADPVVEGSDEPTTTGEPEATVEVEEVVAPPSVLPEDASSDSDTHPSSDPEHVIEVESSPEGVVVGGDESDNGVTEGIPIDLPTVQPEGSDDSDVGGRGVIEVSVIPEPEVKDPSTGEDPVPEDPVTEGESLEVALPEVTGTGEPPVPEGEVLEVTANPVVAGGEDPETEVETEETAIPIVTGNGEDPVIEGEVLEVAPPEVTGSFEPEPVIQDPQPDEEINSEHTLN